MSEEGPASTRRARQKAETRALILERARQLFEADGFERTTIRRVAASAGVALGTIFSHFADKESLLIAALIDDLERANERAWQAMPAGVGLARQMLHLAREGYAAWLRRPALSRVLIREMCFTPGAAREQLRALDRRAMQRVAGLVEEARQRGEVRPDTDPELVVRTAFSVYLTTVLSWLDEPGVADEGRRLAQMVDQTRRFLEQLFAGIGADGLDGAPAPAEGER